MLPTRVYFTFRSAVSIFRSVEYTFHSGERTFRSAEHKTKTLL